MFGLQKHSHALGRIFSVLAISALIGCAETPEERVSETISAMSLRDKIAQKIILDFRYYCDDFTGESEKCRVPFTDMNEDIAAYLESHALGGVILFADNIETIEQTLQLTHDLQKHSLKSEHGLPLFISIDQEGGKVIRTPREWATYFAGNMAIAATPAGQQDGFARDVGAVLGKELFALGVNINHAPVVDVNMDLDNPVINVRSFSDQAEQVAALAGPMAQGMIDNGIMPTLKHFPGHGDTATDSHLALPLVDHDREIAFGTDLLPFINLIRNNQAPMIMTAHIQFPSLDSSMIVAEDGSSHYVPATLSRRILTDLLRGEIGYEGLVVSDAMDMKAISAFFSSEQAAVTAFDAGIDLLLMPFVIRSKHDLERIDRLIDHVADKVAEGVISEQEIDASVRRILLAKEQFNIREMAEKPLAEKIVSAKDIIGNEAHRSIENDLAAAAITEVKKPSGGTHLIDETIRSIHVIMPKEELGSAFVNALSGVLQGKNIDIEATGFAELTPSRIQEIIDTSDLLITGDVTPNASPVDFGGMSDVADWFAETGGDWAEGKGAGALDSIAILQRLHQQAKVAGKKTAFVSLRFPVDVLPLIDGVDAVYATYSFDTVEADDGTHTSPSIDALARILAGKETARGQMPIKLERRVKQEAGLVLGAEQQKLIGEILADKKAGLIVNQSSRVGDQHLIDALQSNGVSIGKLFAVEHGVRGKADAGARITDGRDEPSGLPIVSIYGKKKAPSAEDLEGIDTLVFDLQDVGVRFYTYLSSLHYIMESCARFDTPLVVLDRPNPNISYVDGPILEPEFQTFVGMHPIPVLHGMTLGELARMINGEGWLPEGLTCDLTVVPIKNYKRTSSYVLPVRPSPNLPNQKAIEFYPSLALFEATNVSVGRGTEFPFQVLGGTREEYGEFTFTPVSTPGAALTPKLQDQLLHGQDFREAEISGLNVNIFLEWHSRAQALNEPFLDRPEWLDKLMGTDAFRKQFEAGLDAKAIRASWQQDLQAFKERRAPYLLYPEG